MDCVKLYYKDELLGILTYKEPRYIFVKNEKFSNQNVCRCIGLNEKIEYFSDRLFTFFYKFIPEDSRVDIIDKAGIEKSDSDLEKLKKIARLNLNKNQFWIGL